MTADGCCADIMGKQMWRQLSKILNFTLAPCSLCSSYLHVNFGLIRLLNCITRYKPPNGLTFMYVIRNSKQLMFVMS